ncbi:MAG: 6,7-dimethyl-8-ribityllumazine synthase [Nitrospinota bacterium]|jgi:6,7-dimethyl-8-ribityllumazine synthase|nr:6,7-dimethyl-8-ribityllumazine synthase [Nitrospinota bacterium]MDP7386095.1 6,7-dimethyl-8-ribityllumazine synthase [Nitrospinota bacterium]
MPKVVEGKLSAAGLKFGIVVSRFNHFVTDRLLEGGMDGLSRCGAREADIEVFKVPGTFEIPLTARKLAQSGRYDALVCLGAVIRGSTPHFEYVASEVSKGIAAASQEFGLPIAFGVLTTDTVEQAVERAGTKHGNKGYDAALSAIEMANLMKEVPKPRRK